MSYRVDIPTLSANEVYTLTFEYEGTETIQLIVGDLTLETTDRRVVFTTTSPVNYIESNVNLTNLNIYEGYYESDDFGGEYTQESYIEGMSLVNLIQSQKHLDFQNRDCGVETFEDNMIKLTITDVSSLTSTWQNGWIKTSANLKVGATYTCVIHVVENSISTEGMRVGANYGTLVHGSDSNSLASGETGTIVFTYTTGTVTLKDYNGYYDGFCRVNSVGDWQNGSLKYGIMIFEGDYYDYFINNNIPYFEGIGCVKSPKILSETKHRNIMLNTKPFATTNLITVSDDNTYIYLAETARYSELNFKFTQEYLAQYGISNGDKLCIELDGMLIEGTGTQATNTSTRIGITGCIWTGGVQGYKSLPENGHYCNYITIANNASTISISFLNNTDWTETNKIYEIQNLRVYKIEDISEMGTYDCCKVSTPDDLELYCTYNEYGDIYKQDVLDLQSGTITRNIIKYRLNDYLNSTGKQLTTGEWTSASGNEYVILNLQHASSSSGAFGRPINNCINSISATGLCFTKSQRYYDWTHNRADIEQIVTDINMMRFTILKSRFSDIDYTDSTVATQWVKDQDFTLLIPVATAYTEQLSTSINPLKSYRNGSIQTSSQQLVPTLKTTLPISNKFTTTNLTSGSTYNVYFDGTATKLDAGGTIITNPVSPCEVECGGTTLTIEGTDIQNVRVIETTVKNEVGSINGTTDVELSKVITSDLEVITNDIKFSSASTDNGNINTVDNKLGTINTKGGHGWGAGSFTSNKTYPKGFSLLHIEFDVDMPSDNLMAIINFNNNVDNTYYNFRDLTLNNDTATIAQGQQGSTYSSIVTKGHFSRLMYCFNSQGIIKLGINTGSSATIASSGNNAEGSTSGYTACANNGITISNFKIKVIENYPDATSINQITSLLRTDSGLTVLWKDMDMSIGQTISTLEQPIKLRSLGTTYDSYNPVTGELTKRIGVSETDGSYSVLSSPIVIPSKYKMLQDNNIIPDSFPQQMNSGYVDFLPTQLLPNTTYTIFLDATTASGQLECGLLYNADWYGGVKHFTVGVNRFIYTTGNDINGYYSNTSHRGFRIRGQGSIINNLIMVQGEYSLDFYNPINVPHLYTNGQVKVYSESGVYPTTILNGQSTNNYEINELNKSNNYTIRYEGECESINLANKSNTQGTNRIVKSGATSGNLTFVNDSGDIDNVLLVQNDVREQEINHFNGLQTVEVSKMLIQNQRNMWSQDYITDTTLTEYYKRISKDYIKVVPNETLYCSTGQDIMDYCGIIQYNENKERVTSNQIFGWGTSGMYQDENNIYKNKVQLSENTHYIRICMHQKFLTTGSVSRGDFLPPSTLAYNQYQGQYIDLPQPVQLNSLPDGTCDTYNPITGEYVQNVGYLIYDDTTTWKMYDKDFYYTDGFDHNEKFIIYHKNLKMKTSTQLWNGNSGFVVGGLNAVRVVGLQSKDEFLEYMKQYPLQIIYGRKEPITTQLTPINIPTFEGGILQLITTDGKVFPMVEYSMPTNNRYDTSSWETGVVYTQRNMTEAYFNESTTPMTPTETMTLTTDHISSGSIILNDNGNGLIVLKGNYTGRDIPYFTGMRSVEAIEVETTPSPDQPLFGKGGRK